MLCFVIGIRLYLQSKIVLFWYMILKSIPQIKLESCLLSKVCNFKNCMKIHCNYVDALKHGSCSLELVSLTCLCIFTPNMWIVPRPLNLGRGKFVSLARNHEYERNLNKLQLFSFQTRLKRENSNAALQIEVV